MLLSPGQSPRHLSSPSPSTPGTPASTHHNAAVVTAEPSSRTSKRARVLDEDTYAAAMERIIERDYFPDIPKLRDRLDWLEAVRSADPVQIRDAQLKIIERRRGLAAAAGGGGDTGMRSKSRAQTGTPGSTFFRGASFTPYGFEDHSGKINQNRKFPAVGSGEGSDSGVQNDGEGEVDPSLSLDEFCRRFTSEDNESFNKIMERANRKRKEKYAHLLEGENQGDVKLIEGEKRERVATDGFGTSDQPTFTLDGWKYTAKNLLMYHPADRGEAPLTEEEMAERLKGLTKEISKTNTRFTGKMVDYKENNDDTLEVMYTPVAGGTPYRVMGREDKMKRYDLEDLRKTPNPNQFYVESEKKADNGYSFVKTPSPAPGVDGSPFMTWGDIEGTPLRLEPEDTPIDIGGSGERVHFKIPLPPTRDVKAHSMSREAARKIRERTKMFQKPPLHSRGGSASPARILSPAAQKFVRKAIGKSSHAVDESLRASYSGASPGSSSSTPKAGRSLSRLGRDSIMSMSPSK